MSRKITLWRKVVKNWRRKHPPISKESENKQVLSAISAVAPVKMDPEKIIRIAKTTTDK
jgi:hypothetical protein